jgi:hypothetical protein
LLKLLFLHVVTRGQGTITYDVPSSCKIRNGHAYWHTSAVW